ncbi:DUF5615 family PIN-like protein [Catelliglobosispora koreensis]|uniref:DUF5615 family PIN-like protein n=1 Tax=Catelliglobosispora koreensis TaxID=129052 RepID=UPI0038995D00
MYPPTLAQYLRDNGHDVVAVLDIEVGLASRSDDDVLAWAARNGRCVVTENVSDFARLANTGHRLPLAVRSGAGELSGLNV